MVRRKHIITGLFGSSALLIFAGSASAQTIYDSRGFEAPTFAPGDLEGQDPAGPWYSDAVTSTGVVTTSVAKNGTQSVRLDRAPGDDSRWLITKPLVGLSDLIVVEADLRTAFSDVSESAYGPIFALEAYDAYNNPTGPSVKLAGMVGMDAATGELLYQEAGTGYLAATGDILDADTWYRLRLELDYSTDTYSIYLNGVRKATEGFVDGGIDDFTDADLAAIAGAGDTESRNATGTGWFDNFSIKVGPQWAVDGGGAWTLSGNWIGGTPNSAGATANFLGSLVTPANAPATITLDGDKTVGSIRFNNTTTNGTNANSYVIAQGSGGTLILNNGPTGGRGSIAVLNGTHTISAPVRVETDTDLDVTNDGNLRLTGPVSVNGGARLVKDGQGPARISGPINLATGGVLGSRRGVLTIGSVAGTGGIDVESGGRINVAPQGTTVVRVANLSVAQTGTLDLNDNNLILDALPGNAQAELERVEALVRQGRNGGSWNGNGVTSTAARDESRSITGLAVIRNSDNGTTPVLTSFEGQSVDADDILVKYTYNGDANLDGRINSDDYFRIDRGFLAQPANPTYRDGDFNYDDRVNSDDYFLIDSAFLSQGGTLEGGVLRAVAVPEPGVLSLGALAALGLLGRRGRRTK